MNINEARKKIIEVKEEGSSRLDLSPRIIDEKLSSEDLANLIDEIKELSNLIRLDLSGNQLTDITPLSQLTSLTELNIYDNQISDLNPLSTLNGLTVLVLNLNQISDLDPLSQLTNLTKLYLYNNQISDLEPLSQLRNLIQLDLDLNEISDLDPISQLTNLTHLDLSNNQISNLSPISQLPNLTELNLSGNFSLNVPLEILEDSGNPKKIINYYLKITGDKTRPLNEAKIVVVGEADFGKTLLIHRLIHDEYVETKSTQGIKIERWENVRVNNEDVRLNVWDFGGQEIMHSTHQFFFTRRTIYVLVIDARQNEDKNRTEEWLKRIESFGGDSPIIIVGSHIDQNQRDSSQPGQGYFDINRRELQEKYVNIKEFYGVCNDVRVKGYDDLFNKFRDELIDAIGKLKGIHEPFPVDWYSVKDQLESMKEQKISFISDHDYLESCFDNEIRDEISQDTIREFLNEVGTIIYFKDLPGK